MKLSPILAQYLYNNKELRLSGIGKFVTSSPYIPEPEGKQHKTQIIPDIKFEFDPSVQEDDELISFISAQTGKMKSLASADLESHLEQARQFLNIGKPFFFEGIGTLAKKKSGEFDFTQGQPSTEKGKENRENLASSTEDSFSEYEEMFSPKKAGTPAKRKLGVAVGVIAGLGLAVWGGYFVYKKTIANRNPPTETQQQTIITPDTSRVTNDTATNIVSPPPVSATGTYKFIIEESPKARALDRFGKLISYRVNIKIDSTDAALCKLYFILNATPADTLRIRDSLSLLYVNPVYMKSGKARVE